MAANKKPRRPYTPRASIYPDLHDVGLIFRPIHHLFAQLREGEVDSARGAPIFKDWQGQWCEVVPALEGWSECWIRIAAGEGIDLPMVAVRKLASRLKYDVPMQPDDVAAAMVEIMACQRATLKIPRRTMGEYMRTEQVAIELDRIGARHAA